MSLPPPLKGSKSRHMACQLCRERKVRCDVSCKAHQPLAAELLLTSQGIHPTCTRCRRLSSQCVYLPDRRLSSRDNELRLTEAIHNLKDRLCTWQAILTADATLC